MELIAPVGASSPAGVGSPPGLDAVSDQLFPPAVQIDVLRYRKREPAFDFLFISAERVEANVFASFRRKHGGRRVEAVIR